MSSTLGTSRSPLWRRRRAVRWAMTTAANGFVGARASSGSRRLSHLRWTRCVSPPRHGDGLQFLIQKLLGHGGLPIMAEAANQKALKWTQ